MFDNVKDIDFTMVDQREPTAPKIKWSTGEATREIHKELGRDVIAEIHKTSPFLDWGIYALTWVMFIGLWWVLATIEFGVLWFVCMVVQAIVIKNNFHAIRHDMFFHRKIMGPKWSYIFGVIGFPTLLQPFSKFFYHADHHVYIGWDLSEEKKQDLDKVWKRWLQMLWFPGMFIYNARKFRSPDLPRPNAGYKPPAGFEERAKTEKRIIRTFYYTALAIALAFWPLGTLYGYILPYVLIVPIIVSLRIVFQHGETDPENQYHQATYYRTNAFTRALFYCTLGDGHLVHHIFPRIPIYRCGKAADLIHPILVRHGVPERLACRYLKHGL